MITRDAEVALASAGPDADVIFAAHVGWTPSSASAMSGELPGRPGHPGQVVAGAFRPGAECRRGHGA